MITHNNTVKDCSCRYFPTLSVSSSEFNDLQAEEERIYKEKQLEQEERMAKELARISYETQRDEKMRQYVKENRYVCTIAITLTKPLQYR